LTATGELGQSILVNAIYVFRGSAKVAQLVIADRFDDSEVGQCVHAE